MKIKISYILLLTLLILFLLFTKAKSEKIMAEKSIPASTKYNLLQNQRIRVDAKGSGYYNASRTGHTHQGIDLITTPGEYIRAPFAGKINRQANPYPSDHNYKGVELVNFKGDIKMKIFYCDNFIIGKTFSEGDIIARSQDISTKYGPGMIPHIHVEIRVNNILIDPTHFLI